ncbi:MAG: cyclic pyranopterin monophosphate synthase MoaC [Thermoplasmata archaeon]
MTRQRTIGHKPATARRCVVVGELQLRSSTVRAIRRGAVAKGDPRTVGEIAGLLALKRASDLIPHCHIVPLSGSSVTLAIAGPRSLSVRVEAQAVGPTGVEMEALVGATVALLTAWDMVKYLEKDARGLYPQTRLGPIEVRVKEKRPRKPT